jgi:hypothetical protein
MASKYSAAAPQGSITLAAVIACADARLAQDVRTVTAPPPFTATDYEALRASLVDSGSLLALPELHGGVSGALCAGGPQAAERWLDEFFADHDADRASSRETLGALVDVTWRAFAGGELAFAPLLPDDDAELEDQVQALALWCHGFLSGFGAGAPERATRPTDRSKEADSARSEIGEILSDFAQISRAGIDEEDAADRDRADFALAELKEYARVSAQIVFEDLADRREAAARGAH